MKKLNKNLRICINYRVLNALIIKNRNTLLLIRETLIKLSYAKIYIKFDVIVIFNEIKIKKNYEKKRFFLFDINFSNT